MTGSCNLRFEVLPASLFTLVLRVTFFVLTSKFPEDYRFNDPSFSFKEGSFSI
jgi:hypothetical protein